VSERLRPTEVALIADLLSQEHESVEALAAEVIRTLDRDRAKRDHYVIRVRVDDLTFGIGPFRTEGAALTAARAMHPSLSDEELRRSVAKLWRPTLLDEEPVAPTLGRYCVACTHPLVAHDWPKSKIKGCVVTGCSCGKDITREAAA
jgi:hypothetical protein